MAGSSFFMLLDDIATMLDDVAVMTKVAAKKTAGVLGDDLALNAQQVQGIRAERELPVVWAVAKGSFINKAILVPAAMLISLYADWAITPLLMIGGAYLCFEGVEKLAHKFLHGKEEMEKHHAEQLTALINPQVDMVAFEKDKIKGAIRTDFILSAEIIVIALGSFNNSSQTMKFLALVLVAIVMTVGVYGLVAAIVKLDDVGFWLEKKSSAIAKRVGLVLISAAPKLMKFLSVVGTAAMFLVGGGIICHGVPAMAHGFESWTSGWGVFAKVAVVILEGLAGVAVGAIVLAVVLLIQKLFSKKSAA
jgi:uncharacterized protein